MNRIAFTIVAALLVIVTATNITHAQIPPECSDSAAWIGMGEGLSSPPTFSAVLNGELLACHAGHHNYGAPDSLIEISAWNGLYWRRFASFSVSSVTGYISCMRTYRNQIYIGGSLTRIDGSNLRSTLIRWSGVGWDTVNVPGADTVAITSMTVFNDRAYFTRGKGKDVLIWDGSNWTTMPVAPFTQITQIASDGLNLYVVGLINSQSYYLPDGIGRWNGTGWDLVGDPYAPGVVDLTASHGELYSAVNIPNGWELLRRWDGSSWQAIPLPSGYAQYWITVTPHNGQLFMSCNGIDSSGPTRIYYPYSARYDGTRWHSLPLFNSVSPLFAFVEYNNEIVALSSMTSSCKQYFHYAAKLCDDGTCGTVAGGLYYDRNNNCQPDSNDLHLPGRIVEVKPGPYYAISDSAGAYRTMAPVGTYNVALAPYLYWNQICPANGAPRSAIIERPAEVADGMDFGTTPVPGMHDLRIDIASGIVRPGRESSIAIAVDNVGTVAADSANIQLTLDRHLAILSATPAPAGVSGNMARWKLGSMAVGARSSITVRTLADTTLMAGTDLCSDASVSGSREQTPEDNAAHICIPARSSHDPNDIAVMPSGNGAQGTIDSHDSVLTYTIRFQNNGSDTAYDVAVYDTLSPELDPTTLQLGASSHPYKLSFGRGGALIWRFIKIMLPDSATNEAASQGYFAYSIRLSRGIAAGTSIPNRVSIYFDYNAPVPTNTVVVTTPGSSGVQADANEGNITLTPNPATGAITIRGTIEPGSTIVLRNMLGEALRTLHVEKGTTRSIDVSDLSSGHYLVAITNAHGTTTLPVQIVH